jgi:hypothetical protein
MHAIREEHAIREDARSSFNPTCISSVSILKRVCLCPKQNEHRTRADSLTPINRNRNWDGREEGDIAVDGALVAVASCGGNAGFIEAVEKAVVAALQC